MEREQLFEVTAAVVCIVVSGAGPDCDSCDKDWAYLTQISMPVPEPDNGPVLSSLVGKTRDLSIVISNDLLIDVSSHAIKLSPASRDEISDMSNVMDIAVPLKLCTSKFSHF